MYLACLLWLLAAACGTIINAKSVTRGSSLYSPLRTTTAPLQERARLLEHTFGIQRSIHLAFPLNASRRPWSQRKHESVGENRKKRKRKEKNQRRFAFVASSSGRAVGGRGVWGVFWLNPCSNWVVAKQRVHSICGIDSCSPINTSHSTNVAN